MRIDSPSITGSLIVSSSSANKHSFMGANVGIGISNPDTYKLDVQGDTFLGRFKATSAGHSIIRLDANGGTGNPNLEFANDGNVKWRLRSQTNGGDDLFFVKGDDSFNALELDYTAGHATFIGNVSSSSTSTGSFGITRASKFQVNY